MVAPSSQMRGWQRKMSSDKAGKHSHSHMLGVGIVGVAAGAILLVYVPSLKAVSSVLLLFAGFHLVGAAVVLGSIYVLGGHRVLARLRLRRSDHGSTGFDFGWAPAWTHGPWIAALVLLASAVAAEVAASAYWPLALAGTLLAASFFAGGLITRAPSRYDHAVLPMVHLVPENGEAPAILDAGCGAGRTTIAIGRAVEHGRIVAFDRFDSDYIEGGGRALLESNLRHAEMFEQVRIETGDLTAMPFPDESFDAAVSAHAIDHLGSLKKQGLREIYRVLKPGGCFLLIV